MRRLEAWHQKLFGGEAQKGHLYPGFYALLGGFTVGLAALGLFLYAESLHGAAMLAWREAAIVLAALSAPLVFLGISLALPARTAVRATLAGGAVLAGSTIYLFSLHYPHAFNLRGATGTDHAPRDASLYLLGIAVMVASILVQLISYYIRRQQAAGGGGGGDWAETDFEVPDWLVEKDIEDAMRLHAVAWGDGAGSHFKPIHVNVDDALAPGSLVRGRGFSRKASIAVPDLEATSKRIKGMHNQEVDMPDEVADNPADQLRRLRHLQQEDPKRYLPHRRSWWRSVFRRDRHERVGRVRHEGDR